MPEVDLHDAHYLGMRSLLPFVQADLRRMDSREENYGRWQGSFLQSKTIEARKLEGIAAQNFSASVLLRYGEWTFTRKIYKLKTILVSRMMRPAERNCLESIVLLNESIWTRSFTQYLPSRIREVPTVNVVNRRIIGWFTQYFSNTNAGSQTIPPSTMFLNRVNSVASWER